MLELAPVVVDWQFLVSAAVVLIVGCSILSSVIPKALAVFLMMAKLSVVLLYFCVFVDGTWFYGGDDMGFFERGLKLYETGRNPLTIWTHHEAYYLKVATPSLSLIYFHNFFAMWCFGPYYHSAVFLNLILSAGTVVVLSKILTNIFGQRAPVKLFVVFASLHWTTIAWHSFLNLKEPLVAFLLAGMVYLVLELRLRKIVPIAGLLVAGVLASRIRFYLPIFVVGGVFLSQIGLLVHQLRRNPLVIIGLFLGFSLFAGVFLNSEIRLLMKLADIPGFPYGLAHFTLQPAPWKITEPAGYLLLPAVIHWVMLLPAIIGAHRIWVTGAGGRIIVGTVLAGLIFYGLVPVIASTRHRMPLDMIVILFHFVFLKDFVFPLFKVNSAGRSK